MNCNLMEIMDCDQIQWTEIRKKRWWRRRRPIKYNALNKLNFKTKKKENYSIILTFYCLAHSH